MQERVLGALIIGGIALVGIVWGSIEGISALSRAKSSEKELETTIKESIKNYNTENIQNFDCKMVKYNTIEIPGKRKKVLLFVDVSGYTNDNKPFTIGVLASRDYVLDCDSRFIAKLGNDATEEDIQKEAAKDVERMKKDVYENHSMTSPKILNEILNDSSTSVYKYVLDSKTKYEVKYSPETGEKIEEIINGVKK